MMELHKAGLELASSIHEFTVRNLSCRRSRLVQKTTNTTVATAATVELLRVTGLLRIP